MCLKVVVSMSVPTGGGSLCLIFPLYWNRISDGRKWNWDTSTHVGFVYRSCDQELGVP